MADTTNVRNGAAFAWEKLMRWSEHFDGSRDTSDEARRWAEEEALTTTAPENVGEWKASVETAFEAGRMYERLTNPRREL